MQTAVYIELILIQPETFLPCLQSSHSAAIVECSNDVHSRSEYGLRMGILLRLKWKITVERL